MKAKSENNLRERILTVIKSRAKHPDQIQIETEDIEEAILLVNQLNLSESDLDDLVNKIVQRYANIVKNSADSSQKDLDEVFEAAVYEISLDVNHQGIVEQVYFLLRVLGKDGFEKELGE